MKKSDTVILDEPFSGMDEETKILAAEYIKKHRDGRICIVVTHEKSDSGLLDGGIYLLTTARQLIQYSEVLLLYGGTYETCSFFYSS